MSFDQWNGNERLHERRQVFFATYVDPMVHEAMAIGISLPDVLDRIIQQASFQDQS